MATTKTTKTTAKNTAAKAKGRRVRLGSVWETSNADFMAGGLKPANGQYLNSQWLLDQLGEPSPGMAWRIKVFFKTKPQPTEEDSENTVLIGDVVVDEEPIYQR